MIGENLNFNAGCFCTKICIFGYFEEVFLMIAKFCGYLEKGVGEGVGKLGVKKILNVEYLINVLILYIEANGFLLRNW